MKYIYLAIFCFIFLFSCKDKYETQLIILSEKGVNLPDIYKKKSKKQVNFGDDYVSTSDYRYERTPDEDTMHLEIKMKNGFYKFILQSGGIQIINLLDNTVVVERKYFEFESINNMIDSKTGKSFPLFQSPLSHEISKDRNKDIDSITHSRPFVKIEQGTSRLITTDNKALVYGLYEQVPNELKRNNNDIPLVFKLHKIRKN